MPVISSAFEEQIKPDDDWEQRADGILDYVRGKIDSLRSMVYLLEHVLYGILAP